jgi:mannose-6-phosphate isomerase-like protein (cupin superfamily)
MADSPRAKDSATHRTYTAINLQHHHHKDTDETFIVMDGALRIDFRDGAVTLRTGEMFVVPKGVEHKPYAEQEVRLLLIEPRGVPNTGEEGGERTAQNDVWI